MKSKNEEIIEDIHYLIHALWCGYSYKSHQQFRMLHKLAIKYNYNLIVDKLKEDSPDLYYSLLLELNQHPRGVFSLYEQRECDICGNIDFYVYDEEKKQYLCIKCWDKCQKY